MSALLINIISDQQLDSARMRKTEQVSARRRHNEVFLTDLANVNEELERWVKYAYNLTN